jgi:hypothetical protein
MYWYIILFRGVRTQTYTLARMVEVSGPKTLSHTLHPAQGAGHISQPPSFSLLLPSCTPRPVQGEEKYREGKRAMAQSPVTSRAGSGPKEEKDQCAPKHHDPFLFLFFPHTLGEINTQACPQEHLWGHFRSSSITTTLSMRVVQDSLLFWGREWGAKSGNTNNFYDSPGHLRGSQI